MSCYLNILDTTPPRLHTVQPRGCMREDRHWPNQPCAGRAEVGPTGRLRGGAGISNEIPFDVQDKHSGRWIGIWSQHPVVSNLVCLAFRRSHRLREAGGASTEPGDMGTV